VLSFPNCKINLGLNILQKRADGYHEIQTVFYPLQFCDILELIQQTNALISIDIEINMSGISIKDSNRKNLCVKACELLKKDFGNLPAINMHLHKSIPPGSGLGGGSSDGAFTIMLLNKKFNLGLAAEKMIGYAAQLGSDCPFFIINKPCYASGRGEILENINLNLSAYQFVLVYPGIHISTQWAFSQLTERLTQTAGILNILQRPVESWKEALKNDFEIPVFEKYPDIRNIKHTLYEKGALYASLSGSGSAVYGIFRKEENPLFSFPEHYLVKILPG
jgi:4-diphosphocytidyl-2-C-methyl-D-erythritol kinase